MKHLLNGVAIAAVLAIAAPVWAQTSAPMTPSAPSAPRAPAATAPAAPAPSASSAAAPMKPMATKKRAKRATRHVARQGKSRRAMANSGASTTNQLNRDELARIQSGGSSPPGATNQYGQPMQTYGMPGASQSSPSPHPAMPGR
jgi:hypothetical protein